MAYMKKVPFLGDHDVDLKEKIVQMDKIVFMIHVQKFIEFVMQS